MACTARWFTGLLVLTLAGLPMGTATGAELTDVVDAADEGDPFDIHIEPSFKQTLRSALIRREYPCDKDATSDDQTRFPRLDTRCEEATVVFRKEMEAEQVTNEINIDLQVGLYKDVELHLTVPYIFSDQRTLKYAGGERGGEVVDETNSFGDPGDDRIERDIANNVPESIPEDILSRQYFTTFRLFSLAGDGNKGPERSGFGDLKLGIAWNPFNDERDDTKATLKLAFDYVIPTGEVAKPTNEGVGRGVHELQWTVASSKRFKYLEPYFAITYILPMASDSSLFKEKGPGQTLVEPGQRAEVLFGSEFIPYEEPEFGRKFTIDIGLSWGFTSEGRDYSYLSDALGNSECSGLTPKQIRDAIEAVRTRSDPDRTLVNQAACRWVLDEPGNAEGAPVYDPSIDDAQNTPFNHDGISDYEAFATFGASLGLYFQPTKYVQLRTKLGVEHEQEHFITAARTGTDSGDDDNDTVKFDDPNERNPYYNPSLDAVGNRFRAEESIIFSWQLALAMQF